MAASSKAFTSVHVEPMTSFDITLVARTRENAVTSQHVHAHENETIEQLLYIYEHENFATRYHLKVIKMNLKNSHKIKTESIIKSLVFFFDPCMM